MTATTARDAGPTFESPRARLATFGPDSLGDVELLALVLGGPHALTRAVALHEKREGIPGLARATPAEIGEAGATPGQAAALAAAFELGRRVALFDLPYATAIRGPEDCARYLRAQFGDETQECFAILGLDVRSRVRLCRVIAKGSIDTVNVHPREVFRPLVREGMHSAILCHNHPSGEPDPSESDIDLTHRLSEVGRLVGIPILDHLIVTRARAVSLAAMGMLR